MRPSQLFFSCLIGLGIVSLLGCDNAKKEDATSHSLRFATSADSPPFEFHRTIDGADEIVGFDIDLANAIANALNMALDLRDTDFSSLIPLLQSGRADMVMAYMSITPERQKNVDFSDPYYRAQIILLTPKGEQGKPFDFKGKRIGVQLGTSHEQFAKSLPQKYEGVTLVSLNKVSALIEEMRSGRIDGILLDQTPAKAYAQQSKGAYNIFLLGEGQTDYAIAFPKGSPLRAKVNEALARLKKEGVLQRLIEKWLEPTQAMR